MHIYKTLMALFSKLKVIKMSNYVQCVSLMILLQLPEIIRIVYSKLFGSFRQHN